MTTETNTLRTDPEAPGRRVRRPLLPLATGAAAFGLCCGLPLLGSLGVAGAVVGLGAGSRIAVVIAAILGVIAGLRWRRQRTCHSIISTTSPGPAFPVAGSTLHHQEGHR